jgi:anti-sigma B factor antagonist
MTTTANTGAAAVLRLTGELTIYRAAELKPLLLQAMDSAARLEIDLGEVTEIDTSGVQLLMTTKRRAQALNRELRLCAHSAPVVEVFELLDLAAFFGDPLVTTAA